MALGSIRHHRIVKHRADRVWEIAGDPARLHEWFPGITRCEVNGTRREITLGNGLVMPEEIVVRDDVQMRFQYRITAPLFVFHRGTIDVIALDEESCITIYTTEADPRAMALVVAGASSEALANLDELLTRNDPADSSEHMEMH
jgi:hypothetical protein